MTSKHHYADKYVHSPADIPTVEHWAIITGTSVHIPGDERSRTNPGHGYPESTEHYIEYAAFLTEAKFKEALAHEIDSNSGFGGKSVRGIHVCGTFTSKIVVELSEGK